jgi:hypothetical protein
VLVVLRVHLGRRDKSQANDQKVTKMQITLHAFRVYWTKDVHM